MGECLTKVLSACVAENLAYQNEQHQLLSNMHFGRLAGHSTTDLLHLLVKFIKDADTAMK